LVHWCSVLQCNGLASGEWMVISDVAECGCGTLFVRVCESFHISDKIRPTLILICEATHINIQKDVAEHFDYTVC
jgi:hypothetical protein